MSRRARPWYRQGRSMFFVQIDGKQHPLHVSDPADHAGAAAAHEQLLGQLAAAVAARIAAPPDPAPPPSGRTVADVAVGFLATAEKKLAAGKVEPESVRNYRLAVAHLVAAFGPRPVAALTADELVGWADRPGWSASYQNTTLGTVQQLLRWAGVALRVKRPAKESRGAETCLTDEQFDRVLAEACRYAGAKGDLRELLRTLRETGARPGEVSKLTAELVDWENTCTRLVKHKTKRKTGLDRVIHFNTAAMSILTAQRTRYTSGLLFRTRVGRRYQPNVIVKRLLVVSERVGFRVIAYGLGRHSFATKALTAGVPDVLVAALLGHRGTTMLHRNYSHVGEQSRALKDAAERVSRGKAG